MEFASMVMLLFLIQLDFPMLIGVEALIHDAQLRERFSYCMGAPLLGLATARNVSLRQRLRRSMYLPARPPRRRYGFAESYKTSD